jgi:hypothetical protein
MRRAWFAIQTCRTQYLTGDPAVFCALYSDGGSHSWPTPKTSQEVDPHRRKSDERLRIGDSHDPFNQEQGSLS